MYGVSLSRIIQISSRVGVIVIAHSRVNESFYYNRGLRITISLHSRNNSGCCSQRRSLSLRRIPTVISLLETRGDRDAQGTKHGRNDRPRTGLTLAMPSQTYYPSKKRLAPSFHSYDRRGKCWYSNMLAIVMRHYAYLLTLWSVACSFQAV